MTGMWAFFIRRLVQSAISMVIITVIVFALSRLTGSPADALLPDDASAEQVAQVTALWGLDRPWPEQYLTFLSNAVRGEFGDSLKWQGKSALAVVVERLPASLQLGGLAILISVVIAIPLGVFSARYRGTWIDKLSNVFALFGQALPPFWLGIMMIWLFAVVLGWLPTSGRGGFQYMILPAIAIAWFQIAALTRLTRSAMIDVLESEYIRLARMKGLSNTLIVWKHAFQNAAIVPLTYFGILSGSILTGSIVIESVFAWPGTGWLAIEAIKGRDFPVIQVTVMLFALIYLGLNLLIDLLYAAIDPRVRL